MGTLFSSCSSSAQTKPSIPVDPGLIIKNFTILNRRIFEFCDDVIPPPLKNFDRNAVSAIKEQHLSLLFVVNSNIHSFIFAPFHPGIEASESNRLLSFYNSRYGKDSPRKVSDARCEEFASIDGNLGEDGRRRIIDKVFRAILIHYHAQSSDHHIPDQFHDGLRSLLAEAYDWNCDAHKGPAQALFNPYYPPSRVPFDEKHFEPYYKEEKARSHELNGKDIIAVISMGLETSDLTDRKESVIFTVPQDNLKPLVLIRAGG